MDLYKYIMWSISTAWMNTPLSNCFATALFICFIRIPIKHGFLNLRKLHCHDCVCYGQKIRLNFQYNYLSHHRWLCIHTYVHIYIYILYTYHTIYHVSQGCCDIYTSHYISCIPGLLRRSPFHKGSGACLGITLRGHSCEDLIKACALKCHQPPDLSDGEAGERSNCAWEASESFFLVACDEVHRKKSTIQKKN